MDINQIIINIIVFFMLLAAADRCLGNRFGLGKQLDEALQTIGPMCIPMVGMILLSPLIGNLLTPLVRPFFLALNADPAMFAGCILACDMGGYSLAETMAMSQEAANLSGCILGTSLGGVISFIMPVGISMLRKDYRPYFAVGVLAGVITVPAGLLVGGFVAGYSATLVICNTLPILLLSLVLALALWKAQRATIRIFEWFGFLITGVATAGFAIGIVQELTSFVIIPGLTSVLEGIQVVGSVAIVLCGAYPLLYLVNRVAKKHIEKISTYMGVDSNSVTGILGGFANIMPVLNLCNKMSPAGVTVALAFAVSGSCMFGDYLGFVASVNREMIVPMLFAKAVGSLSAVLLARFLCRRYQFSREVIST